MENQVIIILEQRGYINRFTDDGLADRRDIRIVSFFSVGTFVRGVEKVQQTLYERCPKAYKHGSLSSYSGRRDKGVSNRIIPFYAPTGREKCFERRVPVCMEVWFDNKYCVRYICKVLYSEVPEMWALISSFFFFVEIFL